MTNFPAPQTIPGPSSMRSGGMPVAVDTSGLAQGVAGIARGIGQAVQGLDEVATRQKQQEDTVDIARAEAFRTQKFYDIQNGFAQDTDYATFNDRAAPLVTGAVDKAASLIRDDRVRERWLATTEDSKVAMLDSIDQHGRAIKLDNERAGLIGSMEENARLMSDPSVPRAIRDKARSDIEGSLAMGQQSGLIEATKAQELRGTILDNADNRLALNLAQTDLLIEPQRVATGMAIPGAGMGGSSILNAQGAVDGTVPMLDYSLAKVTANLMGDANFPTDPKEAAAYLSDPNMARDYAEAAQAYLSDRYKGDLSAVVIAMDPNGGTAMADRWTRSGHDEVVLPRAVKARYQKVMGAMTAAQPSQRIPVVSDPGINLGDIDPQVLGRFEQLQSSFGTALPIISGDKSEGFDRRSLTIDVEKLDDTQRKGLFQMASAMGFTGIGLDGDTWHLDATGKAHVWGDSPAWAKDAIADHLAGKAQAIPALVSGVAPEYANLTYDQRLQLYGQAKQLLAQRDIGLKTSLETITANAPAAFAATGKFDGQMPDANTFVHAYGAVEGIQRYRAFEADVDAHKLVFNMRTMPAAAIEQAVQAATPTSSGNTAALEAERYRAIATAADSTLKARAADPGGYALSAYPDVAAAFQAAQKDPTQFSRALTMMSEAQKQLGIDSPELLPKSLADNAVTTFKDTSKPATDRAAAVVGLIQSTQDPAQQKAIYQQLVTAGLPDMTRGVMSAALRGDNAATTTLLRAALIDPTKMGPKFNDDATTAKVGDAIQSQFLQAGGLGDVLFGTSGASADALARLTPDLELIDRAAKLRLVDGTAKDPEEAVRMTLKDMYGNARPVTGKGGTLFGIGAGANLKITLPPEADEGQVRKGFTALQPMVTEAITGAMMRSGDRWQASAEDRAKTKLAAQTHAADVMANGWFENAGDGQYSFYDPFSDGAVAGPDGKALIFTMQQVMAEGRALPGASGPGGGGF